MFLDPDFAGFHFREPARWCTCAGSVQDFRDAGDGLWVHSACGKPTRMFLEAYEARRRKDGQ